MAILRLIGWGAASGAAATAFIAVTDLISDRGAFGWFTLLVGVATGGLLLFIALAMALLSAWLASRQQARALRRRLLTAAVWSGAAGMACGFGAVCVWLAAGRPFLS